MVASMDDAALPQYTQSPPDEIHMALKISATFIESPGGEIKGYTCLDLV